MSFGDRIPKPLGAVLLGALSLVVSPLLMVLLALPLFLLPGFKSGAPVELIAKALHLEGLGGFFGAIMILGGLFWLLGILILGFLSWRLYRDRRLAALTMASAFAFQIAGTVVSFVGTSREAAHSSSASDSAFTEVEREIDRYASLGPPRVSVHGPHDDWGDDYPQYGPYYEFMDLSLPILVRKPASYIIEARFQNGHLEGYGSGGGLDTTLALGAGTDTLRLRFPGGWFRSPAYTGGLARVEMRCRLSQKEYFALVKPRLRVSPSHLRELENLFGSDGSMIREEFVDSASTYIPATIENYVPPARPLPDRDDRGRLLPRHRRG